MEDRDGPDWDAMVEQESERVFRTAYRMLGSVQDAEDVAQDVFTEAFQRRDKDPVQSWTGFLVRLTTLRSIDRIRRRHIITCELRDSDLTTNVGPFEEATAAELTHWLRRSLAELSDQQATVFVMTYFEGMSRDEVASELGISREGISTALHKARQRLLTRLSAFNSGDLK